MGAGPVVAEGNRGPCISEGGGSSLRSDELIVRNNVSIGIRAQDLSTVSGG
jgi:hypothetical protein